MINVTHSGHYSLPINNKMNKRASIDNTMEFDSVKEGTVWRQQQKQAESNSDSVLAKSCIWKDKEDSILVNSCIFPTLFTLYFSIYKCLLTCIFERFECFHLFDFWKLFT